MLFIYKFCRCDGIHFGKLLQLLWSYQMYSQRVTANIHHQLQRWISIFGCLASRTPLVVHFCLYTAENPRKCQQLATFLLRAGGRLQRHTESRPRGNGTNEKKFLYNDYIYRSADWLRAPQEVSGGPNLTNKKRQRLSGVFSLIHAKYLFKENVWNACFDYRLHHLCYAVPYHV